ncbi:hypothetical protein BH10ACI4_BH10ACI4_01730 [soil metagenome]
MPHEVIFSSEAEQQLRELEEYLSERFYPANAERYIRRLTEACIALGLAPYRGTKRNDLIPDMRTIGFERRAAIYFKIIDNQVIILSIHYGGRSFQTDL